MDNYYSELMRFNELVKLEQEIGNVEFKTYEIMKAEQEVPDYAKILEELYESGMDSDVYNFVNDLIFDLESLEETVNELNVDQNNSNLELEAIRDGYKYMKEKLEKVEQENAELRLEILSLKL